MYCKGLLFFYQNAHLHMTFKIIMPYLLFRKKIAAPLLVQHLELFRITFVIFIFFGGNDYLCCRYP